MSLRSSVLGFLCVLLIAAHGMARADYLRSPDIHGDRVFFTAEGDLWVAPTQGGDARRLTRHPEVESQVSVSPDGSRLAFTASYDGPIEAYVMPVDGGMPRRITFDGGRVDVLGWTAGGRVLVASRASSGPSQRRLVRSVDPETLATTTLPVLDANQAAVDPRSGATAFVRFGLQITGDQVRAYRGGAMAQLWRLDPARDGVEAGEAVRLLAEHAGNLTHPMWWQGRLYFASDAGGGNNLWSSDPQGADLRQHTDHRQWTVREPALAEGRIVYQLGADLRVLDLGSGEDRSLAIRLVGDFDASRERWLASPLDYLDSARFSPRGDRVALTARGRSALAGLGPLRRVELRTPGIHRLRAAVPGAGGRWVYAISDASGENEIWRFPANGVGEPEQLTTDGGTHRWRLHPSPDGRYLAHDDKRGRLWLLDLDSGDNRLVHTAPPGADDAFEVPAWSADGEAMAFACPGGPRQTLQIFLYSMADGTTLALTSDRYQSYAPSFSPDGRWLYFLSDRHFQAYPSAPWGDRNFGPLFDRRSLVYGLALQPGNGFPFEPTDELEMAAQEPGEGGGDTSDGGDPELPAIQSAGLKDRLFQVPVESGNYSRLSVGRGRLYLLDRPTGPRQRSDLMTIEISEQSPELATFESEVAAYALSGDGSRLFLAKAGEGGAMYIVDAGASMPDDRGVAAVRVGDWQLAISPREEWRQMFVDAWRLHRDFAFDADMRGVDWNAIRERYEPLVERVTDRWELDDLLGQMTAELGILHSQIRRADVPEDAESAVPATLGAEFAAVEGGLEITRIYRADPELLDQQGPLLEPGVDVVVGDVLRAVNGRTVGSHAELTSALDHQAGLQVLLDLRRGEVARQAVVTPVVASQLGMLEYRDWVQRSTERVTAASGGRIGYLHLRAMGGRDIASFARDFYANCDREGLILDVRNNWGGNVDSWVIEKLLRRAWAFWSARGGEPFTNMQQAFRGHLVVLINQNTYSDGETLAAGVKALDLAPLLGTRTAGAGIWLSDRNPLSDGGMARVAEFPQFGIDGRWLIEGRGVAPDIEVDNSPTAAFRGEDQQLQAAIEYLEAKLAEEPIPELAPRTQFPITVPGEDVD